MPDIAPELLGFVGPVEVPADPPALLLPKPVLGLTPEVAPGVAVGAGGPQIGSDKAPPTPCCAVAVVLVAPTNRAVSMTNCLLRMTRVPFLVDLRGQRLSASLVPTFEMLTGERQ